MNFLKRERAALDEALPGLDAELAGLELLDMEREGNPAIPAFRRSHGPGLLVPAELGGRGASPLEAARVQRAIASRAPSLAVATTMHHFTIATVLEIGPELAQAEAEFLAEVAQRDLIVASGFAEGRTGTSIQTSSLRVEKRPDGYVLNGSKKPCSLSGSMDLFVASAPAIEGMDARLAVVVMPADAPGLERRRFWSSPILAGAESDELVLNDVPVRAEDFFPLGGPGIADRVRDRGFLWFETLITAAYIGIASGLVERVLAAGKGAAAERVALAMELEAAMAAVETVARAMEQDALGNDALARMLLVRYAAQAAIGRASALAVELMGGMAFIQSAEISYLLAAAQPLALHPPSRLSVSRRLDDYLRGAPLVLD